MKPILNWFCCSLLALTSTRCGIAFAANDPASKRWTSMTPARLPVSPQGGAAGTVSGGAVATTSTTTSRYASSQMEVPSGALGSKEMNDVPLRVLFLSADTGGGHRASAEALGKQFQMKYPGTYYELADVWTDHGCLPYRTLVKAYKHLSAHPRQWRLFFHSTNTRINEVSANFHSHITCGRKIRRRIEKFNPDLVVSVHPTTNISPLKGVRKISKRRGKHIPFVTVVTDLGSAHRMWFSRNVDKLYVPTERLRALAKKQHGPPDENIVLTGLPIRHDFAVQAEKLGDRTLKAGKDYQKLVKKELDLDPARQMVLVMGGGEGVGSLSSIVNAMYAKFTKQGIDATICVVCGRNEKLKKELESRDWAAVIRESEEEAKSGKKKRQNRRRSKKIDDAMKEAEKHTAEPHPTGNVSVVGLGFVTNMAEYMVAADVLVSKAGPGTIAEAASLGLPIMLTSFLPGQEAGNVDVVLESEYGDYCEEPVAIAQEVGVWLQGSELLDTMSRNAQKSGNALAASEIVQSIGDMTQAWIRVNGGTGDNESAP